MINFNKLIPMTSDDLFERVDYERLAERFPVPSIRRGASPEPISELRAGVRVEYLGVYVQFVAREAVVSGIVNEWPLGSGEMRMVLDNVDLEKIILAIIEPLLTGTIDTVMQIVPNEAGAVAETDCKPGP